MSDNCAQEYVEKNNYNKNIHLSMSLFYSKEKPSIYIEY